MIEIQTAPHFHLDRPLAQRGDAFKPVMSPGGAWSDRTSLYRLPEHLQRRWWNEAASDLLAGASASAGFESFSENFREFAAYKKIPLTRENRLEVIARVPGRATEKNLASGRLLSVINLGDEKTDVLIDGQRMELESRDAIWAPDGSTLSLGDTQTKADLDLLLLIFEN